MRAIIIGSSLAIHCAILWQGAALHSPTWDEVGHLPSGVVHWHTGRFDLYKVNPPLVRLVAALPVVFSEPDLSWMKATERTYDRGEWFAGHEFIRVNGPDATLNFFAIARRACIPFSALGAIVCYLWARDLYGPNSGLAALLLWCFCPSVLAFGQLITPDIAAAATGLLASYLFSVWLKTRAWKFCIASGVFLGVALLTKLTWIVLLVVWPLIWLLNRGWKHLNKSDVLQFLSIIMLSLYVVNLGYGFEGSFSSLGSYQFRSQTLSGRTDDQFGNRFRGTLLERVPVPLPMNYPLGADRQKVDFETGYYSYLRGEWRFGGWWYYYLYAILVKLPVGSLALAIIAVAWFCTVPASRKSFGVELELLVPACTIFLMVSSQTGFNHHLRYVFPALPFAFVWVSRIFDRVSNTSITLPIVSLLLLLQSVGATLSVHPHYMGYFNAPSGGPSEGHNHLLDSNVDWGQDLLFLREWLREHPEYKNLSIGFSLPANLYTPRDLGMSHDEPPPACLEMPCSDALFQHGPLPGTYAIFSRRQHEQNGLNYFNHFEPIALVAYSIRIYEISLEEANSVRAKLGMVLLPKSNSGEIGDAN